MAKSKIKENPEPKPKARSIQKMNFSAWFQSKVAQKQLKAYQVSEIKVFFKKQGLKDKEEMQTFEDKLNRFLGI